MPEAVFRFDASAQVGFGHAVRSSALAAHLKMLGWRTIAAVRDAAQSSALPWRQAYERVISLRGREGDEAGELLGQLEAGCDLLVVDHYGWDQQREKECRGWTKRIAVIDDLADRAHDCDVLCDPTFGRAQSDYGSHIPATTTLCLGPEFAPLRPEFAMARHQIDASGKGPERHLFVNIGATDPTGLLPSIVDGIEASGFRGIVDIVIASSAPGLEKLKRKSAKAQCSIRLHIDVADVASIMAQAELAIGAAGSTAWERCCLFLPSLVVVAAENQIAVARGLSDAGAAEMLDAEFTVEDLGAILSRCLAEPDALGAMAVRAGAICDGLGAGRVAEFLLPQTLDKTGAIVRLVPVTENHRDIILDWQREPGTRRYARNRQVPGEAEHASWFAARLNDPSCVFHMVRAGDDLCGFIRLDFDRKSEKYEISIVVAPAFHGRGIGVAALAIIRRLVPWAEISAWVHQDNSPSLALFQTAGYGAGKNRSSDDGTWFVSPALNSKTKRAPASEGVS